jgi:hypothetical protein
MGFNSAFKGLIALVSYNTDFRSVTVAVLPSICSPFTPKGGGHAVAQLVEALRYEPECRGFDSRFVSFEFFIDTILPAALCPCGRLNL